MRRWILYALVMGLVLFVSPVEKTDVGELKPVELLYIRYTDENKVRIETDTGDLGVGETLEDALSDLKATASGNIFLDTADYLVIHRNAVTLLPKLWNILRPGTEVCIGEEGREETVDFLSAHKPGVTLNDIRSGRQTLPVLKRTEERYRIEFESNYRPAE